MIQLASAQDCLGRENLCQAGIMVAELPGKGMKRTKMFFDLNDMQGFESNQIERFRFQYSKRNVTDPTNTAMVVPRRSLIILGLSLISQRDRRCVFPQKCPSSLLAKTMMPGRTSSPRKRLPGTCDACEPCQCSYAIVEEVKELGSIAVPLATVNCVVYLRSMVSVLCLGRLGGLELAGGALSIGFTNITGYSVLFGLASGMDPVCAQAFGSKNWSLIGLTLQRTILILLSACVPISLLWVNLQRILMWLGQDSQITAVASTFCLFSLPDLVANSILQPLRVYLRSQGITTPMMWCSALAVLIHMPLNFVLVFVLELGVPGVAIAAVWTNFNMVLFLLTYLWYSGVYKRTWVPWSSACFKEWWPLLSLAVPSCCAICLEWWWYEIMTLLAGYLPDPQVAVATTAILIQTTSLMYTLPLALSSSVSTRVGNELGANRPAKARIATFVALSCALVFAVVNVTWTTVFRYKWGRLFTDDKNVLALTAAAMPIIGLCELGNCPQTTGCGVLRGSARPAVGARINLWSFYFVGTPVAVAMAFTWKVGFEGLWYGLLAAQIACAISVLFVVLRTDWAFEALRAKQLTGRGDCGTVEMIYDPSMQKFAVVSDEEGGMLLEEKSCRQYLRQ